MEIDLMIEREIKSIVSESTLLKYKNILDGLAENKRILQINYYFDTPDFQLNSLGNTLRIRQKGKQLMLQYKYEKQYTGLEKTCKEFETALNTFPQCILSKDLPCNELESVLLYGYVGNLITERLDYIYAETIISLDKSYYLGKCDHEIEIEFQNYENAETILNFLSIENIETHEMGKYNRFVKELQRLENEKYGY